MKIEDAKNEIYKVWKNWEDRRRQSNMLGSLFYAYLEKNHSNLLTFRCNGDRYQVIQGWVSRWVKTDS